MRILWIDPVVESKPYKAVLTRVLQDARRAATQVDIISLPDGNRPRHLRYHVYEALVIADIVRITYENAEFYDAFIIGCFYDLALREAREVSGKAIVTAPCQSSCAIASHLGNTFSILVGAPKAIPKMRENVHLYGYGHRLRSMRPLNINVLDFQVDTDRTMTTLHQEGRKAVEEDGAEVIILGCTAEAGFHEELQDDLGVPVIDSMLAPFKYAEFLAETAQEFGWYPSRKWGSAAPPAEEIEAWGFFDNNSPQGVALADEVADSS